MIEFVKGPNNEVVPTGKEQQYIEEVMTKCDLYESPFYWLNMIYNNQYHFNNSAYGSNTYTFLQEIVKIVKNKQNKIVVMGGFHQDPGHTSGLVVHQAKNNSQPHGCLVSDSYIRFIIKLPVPYKLFVLNEFQVFHFLMDSPTILWTPSKTGSILVYNFPDDRSMDELTASGYYPKTIGRLRVKRA